LVLAGKDDAYIGALALTTVYFDSGVMNLRDFFHDRKSESGSSVLAGDVLST